MAVQGIESVLQQMKATALQAESQSHGVSIGATGSASFANELKNALNKISDTQQAARTQAQEFDMGKEGIGLHDVMVDLQKSSVSLQFGVQVRNKLVAAYQEVMNMQV